jgi:hypothetical protein
MATNYNTRTYLRSLFGDLTPYGSEEQEMLPTGADAVAAGVLPAPMTSFPKTEVLQPITPGMPPLGTTGAAPRNTAYESLKTPFLGNMDVGTFAQLAGMAAAAIGQDDRGRTTMGGRLGGMISNYAGQTMKEGRAYDERQWERQQAMEEKRREFDQRQRESMAVRRANFALNKSFSKSDRLKMWNLAAPELGLPPLQQMGDEHDKTLKAITEIYKNPDIPQAQKRQMSLNRWVEDAVDRGEMNPKQAIDALYPEQTLGGLKGVDANGNPYYVTTKGQRLEGVVPYEKPEVSYKNRGDVTDVYQNGKYVKSLPIGARPSAAGGEGAMPKEKPVTDADRARLLTTWNKATNFGKKEPSETDRAILQQMADRQGLEIKDVGKPGIAGWVADKVTSAPRYGMVPKRAAGQTPPPGYRDSGRMDVNGRRVWISADGKTAWVAD